ncbi:MAG TPA: DNA-binding domain-containing protein [Vicinamibacterales bacterium]|nr:DNA-binding domain-containing protein [Vicinamibacterales bacterium]
MSSLADVQAAVRQSLITNDVEAVKALLAGGADPARRFAIHQRHYQTSLVNAILGKFPATVWLVGSDAVADAARAYVRVSPPERPCIAEYGDTFPAFLARHERAPALPCLESFAELEWLAGQVSIAVDRPRMAWPAVASMGIAGLLRARLRLQPGLRYLRASWAIDGLMSAYLTDSVPARFVLDQTDRYLEIRGARGALHIGSLGAATYTFRSALFGRRPLGEAAEAALGADEAFDAGRELMELVAAGLVTAVGR